MAGGACATHGGDYFHPIDLVRQPDQDSSTEVVDYCGGVGGGVKFSFDDFEFEFSHIFREIVVVADTGISEPGGGFGGGVGTLEGHLKIFDKVWEGPK